MSDLETTKKQSARRQIEAAIKVFHEGKLDCAITLAAAAEGLLPPTDDSHLFQMLQPYNAELDINLVINWLKHSTGPQTATISQFEAALVVARGITKFVAAYHQSCQLFEDFLNWTHDAGHLPKFS